jgi:enoyl-[acyl-carrier protein] reductase/trans-2-enoyl-CoA reductase (NAD+)
MYNLKGLLLVARRFCYRASTGFGLASRISSALDLMLQPVYSSKTAYRRKNSLQVGIIQLLSKRSKESGLYAKSVNGDVFSDEVKRQTLELKVTWSS